MAQASPLRPLSVDDALKRARRPRLPGHGLDASGQFLDIGRDRIALSDVTAFEASGQDAKDFFSTYATAAVFGSGAMLFLVAVAELNWRSRFLGAVLLLGLIALFALIDLRRVRWHRTYVLDLDLRDGTRRHFVTADEAVAARIIAALDAAGVQASTH